MNFRAGSRAAALVAAILVSSAAAQDSRGGAAVPAASRPVPRDVSALLVDLPQKHGVPGLVAGLVDLDGLVAIGAAGVRRADRPEPVRTDDLFHLGSCTKSMTATLCGALVEAGLLQWTTSLGDVFATELGDELPAAWRPVTLEQLLTNAGGVPGDLGAHGLWGELWNHRGTPVEARRLLLRGVLKSPPAHAPGTTFEYSNGGFALAGHMAETVAKRPFEDLLRERLFQPLGMTTAGYGAPGSADAPSQPCGHDAAGKPCPPGPNADNPPAITPAGRVHCTLADWARYVALHLRAARGDAAPFKVETFDKLRAPGPWKNADYAMGWKLSERPWADGAVLTHSGSNNLWYCVAWLAPKKGFALLAACNRGGDGGAKATDDAVATLLRKMR
jgi:CubicO group peptidase (beta-lactamase class C family)